MRKVFLILGIVTAGLSAIAFLVTLFSSFLSALVIAVSGIISSLPYFALAYLLERVAYLEAQLSTFYSAPSPAESPTANTPTSGSVKDALDW